MLRQTSGLRVAGLLGALGAALLLTPPAVRAQGVSVAMIPAQQTVSPGTEFELQIRVTESGSNFNGFDAVVGYDPAALTLVPMSPISLQEGTLMTGACGNRFHRFHTGTNVDTVTDILLCAGVSVTGPGQIYRLRFRASSTIQSTTVRLLPGTVKFYNSGLYVIPVSTSDAQVGIGTSPTAVFDGTTRGGKALSAAPNPSRGRVVFTLGSSPTGPESLTIRDVQGRLIRQLAAASRQVSWDARGAAGELLPNGTYFVTLEARGRSTTIHFSLIH